MDHHRGIDLVAPVGTPILAPAAGKVVVATTSHEKGSGWGIVVQLDHGNGLHTYFAHLKEARVQPGQRVEAGQVIATLGGTGRVTGPHLHFEIWQDQDAVDPASKLVEWQKGK